MLNVLLLPGEFSVCQIKDIGAVDWAQETLFLSQTDEEISLVCRSALVPAPVLAREDGWRALKIAGPLDFALVGVLAQISALLAARQIPIFAVSTFNTDYILVKTGQLETAVEALRAGGYRVSGD